MNTTTNNVKMFKGPFKENNKKNAPTTNIYIQLYKENKIHENPKILQLPNQL